jgi:UDP-N-acetylmuramoyl-L-alanyl-D-glutamate--2,6-diaminopimelate ligase
MNIGELAQLVPAVFDAKTSGEVSATVESLSYDSRQVFPGVLFVCLVGEKSDGHVFAQNAAGSGAVGYVIDHAHESQFVAYGLPYISVTNTREALPYIASAFYKRPSTEFDLVGITGTNGKTTVSYMLAAIWQQAGEKSGVIGTVGAVVDSVSFPTNWTVSTTPESLDLQQFFAQMRDEHVKHVAMEVTSIAIDQERTSALDFDTAIFTNLTQDHLDYHGTMEQYEAVKSRLFLDYPSTKKPSFLAVVNVDDPAGLRLIGACKSSGRQVASYGAHSLDADFRATDILAKADSTTFTVVEAEASYQIRLPIGGLFNISNALAAVAATRSRGISATIIQNGLGNLAAVPGRFEPVVVGDKGFHVVVDYAHTPDGLENVLRSALALNPSRLIVVFGCGGNRDRTKRPKMGKIADDLADVVVITSDNPRREDPQFIVDEIASGIASGVDGERVRIILDRREAIHMAICGLARVGDLIVIAGKGHETYQEVGERRFPFDDLVVAGEALQRCS